MKSESGIPGVLWSNGKNIIGTYYELFERKWNNKKATTIPAQKLAKEKAAKAAAAT